MPPKAAPRRQPARRDPEAPPPATESAVTTTPNAYDNLPESSTDVEHAGSAADSAAPGFAEPRPQTNPSATSASSRPPVQRLQSLNRRTPSDTFSASTTSSAPTAKPTMKFKPKSVIRRSKEERDAQERLEAERRQARLAAAGVGTQDSSRGGAAGRGALRGLRGRGTGRWQNFGDRYGEGAMSGPFGAGVVAREEAVKRKATRGGVRSSTTTSESRPRASSRVKNEPGAKADRDPEGDVVIGGSSTSGGTKIKTEEQGTMDISSDDEEHQNEGPRMNIEQINLVSDEESDAEPATNKGKGRAMEARSSGWILKPIRIDRKEHIERAVGVNTEASSLTSAELRKRAKARGDQGESLFLPMDEDEEVVEKPKKKGKEKTRDVEFLRDERKWRGVYQDEKEEEEDAKIKKEPTEDEDAIAVDFAAGPVRANDTNEPDQSPTAAVPESLEPSVKPKAKRRRKLTFKETKPVLQTEEDRQEWARHEEDIRLLDEELRLMDTGPTPMPPPTKDSEGDTSMEDGVSTKMAEQKEGRIYLIQLPPLVPKLVDQIKTESSPLPEELPPPPLSRPPVAAHKPKTPAAPPSAKMTATAKKPSQPTIKPDPDLPPKQPTTTTALTASHLSLRTGRVGTLKLKQSGRVVLAWGGASLELGRGADSEFLQDVVLANSRRYKHGDAAEGMDEGFIAEEARGGGGGGGEGLEESGWGLGQVMGKFVVLPDWRRLFGA